jgi:hypothetical protein
MFFVGRCQDFAFVDEVDAKGFKHLRLGEVSDADLGHDGDRYYPHDLANLFGRSHAGDPAFGAYVGRDSLKGHNGYRPGILRYARLLGVGHIHDHAAF